MNREEQAAQDASMVLARANLFDQRIRANDPAITAVWAQAIAKHNLDRSRLLDAGKRRNLSACDKGPSEAKISQGPSVYHQSAAQS